MKTIISGLAVLLAAVICAVPMGGCEGGSDKSKASTADASADLSAVSEISAVQENSDTPAP